MHARIPSRWPHHMLPSFCGSRGLGFSSGSDWAAAGGGGGHDLLRNAAQDGSGSGGIADSSLEDAAQISDAAGSESSAGGGGDGGSDQGAQRAPDSDEMTGTNLEDAGSGEVRLEVETADEVSGDWPLAEEEEAGGSGAGRSAESPRSAGGDSSPHRSRARRGQSGQIDTDKNGSQSSGSGGHSSSVSGSSSSSGGGNNSSTGNSSKAGGSGGSDAVKGALGSDDDGHVLCQKFAPAGCHLVKGQVRCLLLGLCPVENRSLHQF